jgi:peptide/nickel transport system ATP-binding protein
MTLIAHVEQLSICAGTSTVLDHVELVVAEGSVVALVGSSGDGKTTLLQALIGHVAPGLRRTAGSVAIDGSDPFALDTRALRRLRRTRVAFVGQDPMSRLCPSHRVRDVVGELAPSEDRDSAIAQALARAGLPDDDGTLLRRRAYELSGGQLRRLALARALVREPALLLLDEPTGGLDPPRARQMATELRAVAERGTAIVMASHDLDHVNEVADVVIAIKRGRVASAVQRTRRPQSLSRASAPAAERLRAASVRALAGDREVVSDLSISARAGATLALVGQSGSGKTTLLRYLAGLAAGSGHVVLDGRPLARHVRDRNIDERRRIQYVPQDPLGALNPARTVADTLARPLRRHRRLEAQAAAKAAGELLEAVALPAALLQRRPHQLSGGQRQRVALARALAADPHVLLCDEMTSALDVQTSHRVLEMLADRQKATGLTIIWATHDLALARRFADDTLDLDHERADLAASTAHDLEFQAAPPQRDGVRLP